ncbi:ribosome biogenesis GTP-binding protein YihA/YsxC [Candidatus Igneacidithiobacillus taiwanensis]|uniref:ribosome biogenesis GTP-binding protein YihA/YsxC n=1 Tax=Candidatus Igneacidithiobacillus taiwanensis TaxID=1945924 RepID=UPI0028A029A5|nr:ribosome biogenesis GTP-binding protein YihA/YsxC [Candidatus Igneacidithiobacillus taiwanensis]MCE5360145.1 YihA family ribosome biogenesis GTP-binding protein [Acidithiobacillus sp.]
MERTKQHLPSKNPPLAALRQAEYLLSVTRSGQLPADSGAEVAMAGRSNVGKSSVLNRVCGQRALARVSRTPGRTQALNFFTLGTPAQRLVDLPGYGYAKVPEAMRQQWGDLLSNYLRSRQSLQGLILVMDVRHPLMPFDCDLLRFAAHCQRPVHVLLNKADKLSRGAARQTLLQLLRAGEMEGSTAQLFSAKDGDGLAELQEKLACWLKKSPPPEAGNNSESSKGGEDSHPGQGGEVREKLPPFESTD